MRGGAKFGGGSVTSNRDSSLTTRRYRYFSSTHRTDLSRFRGTFHSFDPVGFAIFAIPQAQEPAAQRPNTRRRICGPTKAYPMLALRSRPLRRQRQVAGFVQAQNLAIGYV